MAPRAKPAAVALGAALCVADAVEADEAPEEAALEVASEVDWFALTAAPVMAEAVTPVLFLQCAL